eukprot:CAMPEP_0175270420 /NCGR_PEP_ID=MMETSP0093-20121207/45372_1 /TAXON_ID=311494 /ORGANISM="Alexandrium monilatum, Strain CCMP3105" /LENGTH=43 /DNA_ID= /DNA_START= /DNA_END= /DNA_ORIENTATION=
MQFQTIFDASTSALNVDHGSIRSPFMTAELVTSMLIQSSSLRA